MSTEWRQIPDWEGLYEASSDGRIRAVRLMGRVLSPAKDRGGYWRIILSRRGVRKSCAVHRLVCAAFHGRPPAGKVAAHSNGKRWDNRADNLRWATYFENANDMLVHGTRWMGERHHAAKLSDQQVAEIRAMAARPSEIAARYKISESQVYRIIGHRTRRIAAAA